VNKSTMDKKGKESCQSSGVKSGNANITDDRNRLFLTVEEDRDESNVGS
jgi:hypothetical protein